MYMKKFRFLLRILLAGTCFAFLCSCQGKQEVQKWDNNAYYDQVLQGESISEALMTPTPTVKPQETPDPTHLYSSFTDLSKLTDPNWNEDTAYQEALAGYDSFIGENTIAALKENYEYGLGLARFAIAYINEDDIPEVLICFDNRHTCGMHIFTWIPDEKRVVFVGTFSSFGEVLYVEKQNRITSQYGNGGYFFNYISAISANGKPELIRVNLLDGTGRNGQTGIICYENLPIPENVAGILDGSQQGFSKATELGLDYDFTITDEYLVTDQQSEDNASGKRCTVYYDDMVQVNLKLIGELTLN